MALPHYTPPVVTEVNLSGLRPVRRGADGSLRNVRSLQPNLALERGDVAKFADIGKLPLEPKLHY